MLSLKKTWIELTPTKLGSFLAGVAGAAYLIYYCATSAGPYLMLFALLGAIVGFLLGVVAAPLTEQEATRFSEVGKIISTFLGGYLLSKLDPLITALVTPLNGGSAPITAAPANEQAMVALAGAGLAFLFVLGARLYWMTAAADSE